MIKDYQKELVIKQKRSAKGAHLEVKKDEIKVQKV